MGRHSISSAMSFSTLALHVAYANSVQLKVIVIAS
jgi:hypothetical protein